MLARLPEGGRLLSRPVVSLEAKFDALELPLRIVVTFADDNTYASAISTRVLPPCHRPDLGRHRSAADSDPGGDGHLQYHRLLEEGRTPAKPEYALNTIAPGAAMPVIRGPRQAAAVLAQTLPAMNASTSAAR